MTHAIPVEWCLYSGFCVIFACIHCAHMATASIIFAIHICVHFEERKKNNNLSSVQTNIRLLCRLINGRVGCVPISWVSIVIGVAKILWLKRFFLPSRKRNTDQTCTAFQCLHFFLSQIRIARTYTINCWRFNVANACNCACGHFDSTCFFSISAEWLCASWVWNQWQAFAYFANSPLDRIQLNWIKLWSNYIVFFFLFFQRLIELTLNLE